MKAKKALELEQQETEVQLGSDDELCPSGDEQDDESPLKLGKNDSKTDGAEKKKKKKKKSNGAKMWRFANSIGVEDNSHYPKFKEGQRLLVNMSNCKYFVIRFVAKKLFNFKLTFKNQEVD